MQVIMSDDCEGEEEDVQLLQDVVAVMYVTEKRYRDGSEKNWKRSVRRKANRFKIIAKWGVVVHKERRERGQYKVFKKEVNIKYLRKRSI